MRNSILIVVFMFSFFNLSHASYEKLAYNFKFKNIDGSELSFDTYKNKIIVVVNVASRCGYTPQYEGLQKLWEKYQNKGVVVIGVPTNNFKQEPGSNKEIKKFCETNFGINFPMTEKVDVIGKNAHPFYIWAKKNHGLSAMPKWNFHKIIVGKNGKVVNTFASFTKPDSKKFLNFIEQQL